jgi:hypothetical protein
MLHINTCVPSYESKIPIKALVEARYDLVNCFGCKQIRFSFDDHAIKNQHPFAKKHKVILLITKVIKKAYTTKECSLQKGNKATCFSKA